MTSAERALRKEVAELREQVRQLRDVLGLGVKAEFAVACRDRLGIPEQLAAMLQVLLKADTVSYAQLRSAMAAAARVDSISHNALHVQLVRLRRALTAHGVAIATVYGVGLRMERAARDRIVALLDGRDVAECAEVPPVAEMAPVAEAAPVTDAAYGAADDAGPTGLLQRVEPRRAAGLGAVAIAAELGLPVGQVNRAFEELDLREQSRQAHAARRGAAQRRPAPDPTHVVSGVLPAAARQPARLDPQRASGERRAREWRARVSVRFRLRDRDTGLLLGAAGVGLVSEPAHAWIGTETQLAALCHRHLRLGDWRVLEVPPESTSRPPRLQMGARG